MENDKLFELMSKMYGEMQSEFGKIREEMQEGFGEIKEDISELKEGQQRIENKLDDIESNNADRHLTINGDVKKIKSSLSKVEIVAADNWSDIARMKASKRHRVK